MYISAVLSCCCSKVSTKRFLKRNLADVGMSQCMNALADKVHNKMYHAHRDMHVHSITRPHLFNNHPYISSSGFTAAYYALVHMCRRHTVVGSCTGNLGNLANAHNQHVTSMSVKQSVLSMRIKQSRVRT